MTTTYWQTPPTPPGYSWVSTWARTGQIIADLPLLDVASAKVSIGRYETATGTLPIDTEHAPVDWQRATKPGAVHLILLADNPSDPAHGIPQAGFRVTSRTRGQGDTISLGLATVESYLDLRYVGDQTFSATGQNTIASNLITTYIADGSIPGLPIRVQTVTAGAGTARDKTYQDVSDKTVYSCLADLSGIIGGPEWTIGWEWQHSPERLTPVFYVGDRIGVAKPANLDPAATFEIPDDMLTFSLVEDWTAGKGATDVMAVSSGTAGARPQSPHETATDTERPRVEFRFTPSTSITDVSTLTGHAQTALAVLSHGTQTIAVSMNATTAPALGVDWSIGDDVGFVLGGIDANGADTVPSVPGGIKGVARVIGWELTLSVTPVITPTLVISGGVFA